MVDISRDFLNSNGAKKTQSQAIVTANVTDFFTKQPNELQGSMTIVEEFLANLARK